jgi:hypothetical protein
MIIILMIEIKSKYHIYKKDLVNQLTMIFQKHNLKKHDAILIQHGWKNILISWNTSFHKMLRIVYIVISSDQALKILAPPLLSYSIKWTLVMEI